MTPKCDVVGCDHPATIFEKSRAYCPKHYLEVAKEGKKLTFKQVFPWCA